jgi:hypothetical protein
MVRVLNQHAVKAANHSKPASAEPLLPLKRVVKGWVICNVLHIPGQGLGLQLRWLIYHTGDAHGCIRNDLH